MNSGYNQEPFVGSHQSHCSTTQFLIVLFYKGSLKSGNPAAFVFLYHSLSTLSSSLEMANTIGRNFFFISKTHTSLQNKHNSYKIFSPLWIIYLIIFIEYMS